jgi:ribosomal protein S18 acetylase RimI-like enzyme
VTGRSLALRLAPPVSDADRRWLIDLWRTEWGGETMITHGRTYQLTDLDALIAWDGDERIGAATYWIEDNDCELTSLNATAPGRGVGTMLLSAVEDAARTAGAHRLRLITTNDNVDALRFYQRRGYRLAALYPGAVDEARKQKPTISLVGSHDIPLHDEIELHKVL